MKKALFFRNQDFSSYLFHVNKTLLFYAFPLICFLIQDVCNRLPFSRQWPGCGLQLLLAITQTVGYLLFASNLAMCSLFLFLCPHCGLPQPTFQSFPYCSPSFSPYLLSELQPAIKPTGIRYLQKQDLVLYLLYFIWLFSFGCS